MGQGGAHVSRPVCHLTALSQAVGTHGGLAPHPMHNMRILCAHGAAPAGARPMCLCLDEQCSPTHVHARIRSPLQRLTPTSGSVQVKSCTAGLLSRSHWLYCRAKYRGNTEIVGQELGARKSHISRGERRQVPRYCMA